MDTGETGGDIDHGGPVGLAGSTAHQVGDAGFGGAFHDGGDGRCKPLILQMAMGIE